MDNIVEPDAERALRSQIAEHKKFRRQCEVRIKSGLQLCIVAVFLGILSLWYSPDMWLLPGVIFSIPIITTTLEAWAYRKHDKALQRLEKQDTASR